MKFLADKFLIGKGINKLSSISIGLLLLIALFIVNLTNYLLFHSLVEFFIIIVSCSIFMLAWNARKFIANNHIMFLSIALFYIGIIDIFHILSYKGMGVFPNFDANLPTQLWIIMGYTKSISFLLMPLISREKFNYKIIFSVFTLIFVLALISVFYWQNFPVCFVEGKGLTDFKKVSEIVISIIFIVSILLLQRIKTRFDERVFPILVYAIAVNILAEIAFIFYMEVYGFSNMIGHFLLLTSMYLIYKAVIETGLKKPMLLLFREIKLSQEKEQNNAIELDKTNQLLKKEILERKTAEKEVRKYAAELKEANISKDKLFSIISHDLKNPFLGLLSLSKALKEKKNDLSKDDFDNYTDLIYSSTRVLYDFVNNLLKWSRIQMDKIELQPARLNLNEKINNVCNLLRGNALNKKIEIINNVNEEIYIFSDTNILYTVLENLITNAIKFTHFNGKITISTVTLDDFIQVSICDNGIGIEKENIKKLFKIDYFYSTPGTANEEGSGLGLMVCKEFIEKTGGKIWVESQPGKGSSFYFTIPKFKDELVSD